ncbi:MAG: hypothetical protein AAF497_28830 [Planctomycetota bacterium]
MSLLRFLSKDLTLDSRVEINDAGIFVVLTREKVEVGRRRVNKLSCCRSPSPCIGTIVIEPSHQKQFELPPFVHVSICYDELQAAWEASNNL